LFREQTISQAVEVFGISLLGSVFVFEGRWDG